MAFRAGSVGRVLAVTAAVLCPEAGAQQPADIPVVRLDVTGAAPSSQLPALPVTRLDARSRATDLDGVRAVSLTFSEPLPVRDVLLMLFRGTSFSIVFEPGVTGKFIGELSDLTLRQALEAVLFPVSVDYSLEGTVVRAFPRRPETRLFEVSHLAVQRESRRRVRALTTPDGLAAAADLSTATRSDFFGELESGVRALLSQAGSSHVDRKAGLVQVTDFADRLDQIGLYLETVTLRATRQVRLHARVLEITLTDALPIDWAAVAGRAGSGVRPGRGAGIRVDDFDALFRTVSSFGAVRLIAAPQVVAMNNEPAVMRVGSQQAVFVTSVAQSPTGAPGEMEGRLVSMSEGLTMTITPQIGADGVVLMSVSPTFTARQHPSAATAETSVVEADTVMRVHQGETAVISGLLRAAVEQRPPLDGSEKRKPRQGGATAAVAPPSATTEFIVLLTPTVVMPGSSAAVSAR
jgi:hypothetical protein